jgi:SPX domain protein involved in polyphosphate accumulation
MKFGETLYQRSIPQWAPYNVDYNSLKRLIKQRTTETASGPVSIPGQGPSHAVWKPLDDELFPILKHEHDRAALFIRSKLGEINRRLAHVERQAQLAGQKTAPPSMRPIQQTRKYQRLVEELDSIGNDIEALSRFASAQRLAFRKILKKYRKWTGSPGLHIRMNNEVLGHVPKDDDQVLGRSRNALNPDMSQYLLRLNVASTQVQSIVDQQRSIQNSRSSSRAPPTPEATPALSHFEFERALITTPDSRTKRTYWIHPENLDEVKVLLMRRLKPWSPSRGLKSNTAKDNISSAVLLDDESGLGKARNIAVAKMVARWSDDDFAYIRERCENKQILEEVRRKDLLKRLEEKSTPQLQQVALINSTRAYFVKDDGDARVATLETSPQIGHFNHTSLEDAILANKYPIHMQTFPFSVLTITYSDTKLIPRIVTVLDHSHLVELVPDFSLESHAMYTQAGRFEDPPWKSLLESDIRKVPAAIPKKRPADRRQGSITASSGPSSTEGQDSIFSRRDQYSSQTSVGTNTDVPLSPAPMQAGQKDPMSAAGVRRGPRRKRKSYGAIQAEAPQRYWNEFDDEPEFNGEEAYTIYVTPDEPFKFPGADTISKAFGATYQSLREGKKRILSWLPLAKSHQNTTDERTGLLGSQSPTETDREADVESSSDDNIAVPKKARRIASRISRRQTSRTHYGDYSSLGYPRRSSRDQLLYLTSIGLHVLAWMFLIMATILKGTGRRKAAIEVDAGVISGIVISVACGMFAIGCALARREPVSMSEWTVVSLLVVCEVVWCICLGVWLAQSAAAGVA